MKWHIILAFAISFVFYSCENDLTNLGGSIQPAGDAILLGVDSFSVSSENYDVPFIYSKPDSLLLGTFYDETYGTVNADILTQVQPPVDFSYPAKAVADSAKLMLVYYSAFGDKYAPLEVNAYLMDKNKTFQESKLYQSDINVSEYCSENVLLGSRIFSATDYAGGRTSSKMIEIKLDTTKVFRKNGFSAELKEKYTLSDQARFHDNFNGIYITTKFGSASILNIQNVYMRYYYHYKYVRKAEDGITDSTVIVSHYQDYPANEEVRTVNRVQLPQKAAVLARFNADPTKNIVAAPANIYTRVTLPLNDINTKLAVGVNGKKMLINRAILRVNATDVKDTTLAVPLVSSILLINEDSVDNYFKTRKLPSTYESVVGNVTYEYDSSGAIQYYYKFNLSKILTHELAKSAVASSLKFRLVPVSLSYDGSNNIREIKQQNLMRAVTLCSGTHGTKPMKLQMVFSGF